MTFTIHIPIWILWVIGIPLVLFVLLFAWVGWAFSRAWNRSGSHV